MTRSVSSDDAPTHDTFEDHCWRDVVPPAVLDVYRPYRRHTGVVGQAALLAVDLFAAVFPEGPGSLAEAMAMNQRSCGPYAWQAKPVIARLLALFRGTGRPVLYSTTALDTKTRQPFGRTTNRGTTDPDNATDWAADYAIHPDFAPAPGEHIVTKSRASAFFGTDLAARLEGYGIETLVICGESTSGCVRATTVDAYSYGLHAVVVEDAVFDRSELSHKVSLFDLHHKYADVMCLAELESHLR